MPAKRNFDKRNEIDKIEKNWQKPTTNREKTTRINKIQFFWQIAINVEKNDNKFT